MSEKQVVVDALLEVVGDHLSEEDLQSIIEVPSNSAMGDYAFPCFRLAKVYSKAPNLIAEALVPEINADAFMSVEAVGPYINFRLQRPKLATQVVGQVLTEGSDYGVTDRGHQENVTIDMSSPNIAKPMSMGHLRSTVIGNSIALILKKLNYNVIRINHLGDWGTQFGKLIVAYQKWGDPEKVKADPVTELVKLYVEFHERAEEDPSLDDEGRAAFKRLEEGDPELLELWNWFRDESLKEFQKVYDLLDVGFDHYQGEAFYNDKMDEVIDLLKEKGLATEEQGALIVRLDEFDLQPALIKKSDGATLYMTRDLATALYRYRTYDFVQNLYVMGNEQSYHFRQLQAVLKKMGYNWAEGMHHIPFGLITLNGKKLSTRKGKIVLLEKVLNEAIDLAYEQIKEKNPNLENKAEVARQVGVGAVIFHDLKTDRMNNFDFKLEEIVQFEGETGPYVQYAHARIQTLLSKYGQELPQDLAVDLEDDDSWEIVKLLANYPETIIRAAEGYEPSVVAKYLVSLAQAFNKYYAKTRILEADAGLESRIALVAAVAQVLEDGLGLLGIEAPDQM